jgi:hypothetical protein
MNRMWLWAIAGGVGNVGGLLVLYGALASSQEFVWAGSLVIVAVGVAVLGLSVRADHHPN